MDPHGTGDRAGGAHRGARPLFVLLGLALASVFWSIVALEALTAAFVVLSLARQIRTADALPPGATTPVVLWLAYAAGMLLAIACSPHSASRLYLAKHWHAFVFPAVLLLRPREGDLRVPAAMLAVSGAAACAAALLRLPVQAEARFAPLFVGEMTFNLGALAAGIAAAACFADEGVSTAARRAAAGGLILILISLAVSTGRAPLLLLALAVPVIVWPTRRRALAGWLVALAAVAALAPERLWMKFSWLMAGLPLERYAIWELAGPLLRSLPPLGFGPGTFHALVPSPPPTIDPGVGSWHSEPLQTILEGGWAVAAAYGALVLTALVRSTRSAWRAPRTGNLAVAAGTAAFAAEALVNALASSPAVAVIWWAVLGTACTSTNHSSDP